MFYVNGTNIKLTRGDSASLSVSLDGYEMQDGDTLLQYIVIYSS